MENNKKPKLEYDVLVLDPNPQETARLEIYLVTRKFRVQSCNDLKSGIIKILDHTPSVIITELMGAEAEGIEGLRSLKRLSPLSSIIVHTIHHDPNMIKKFGTVFEIIQKPSDLYYMAEAVDKALNYYDVKSKALTIEKTSEEDLKEELEWLLWREQNLMTSRSNYGKNILETLIHSIFQGRGIGGIMSLMEMLDYTKVEEGENVLIPKDVFQLLKENLSAVQIMKDKMDRTIKLFDTHFVKEKLHYKDIMNIMDDSVQAINYLLPIRNHTIHYERHDQDNIYYGNKEFLKISFKELITNAIKYSPDNAIIYIFTHKKEDESLTIVILNSILPIPRGVSGIPPELEHEVFVPFYKINNTHDDRYFQEELGLGIGLSIINTGISQLNGKIRLYEVLDHVLSTKPEKKVCAELTLMPVEKKHSLT
jgi:signal transduction histidine kinase